MLQKIWFSTFRAYVKGALNVFFKNFQVEGAERVPKDGPVIFVANHQNAFLDPIVIACKEPRHMHFLARASVFQKKIAAKALGTLNMMPVFRMRDGIKNLSKNDVIVDRCIKLLEANKPLMIFPEGVQYMKRFLRPLRKGVCRIAFAAEEANNFTLGVKIVPVGINYDSHSGFRQNVLLNYGEPIDVADYRELYEQDPKKAMNALRDEMQNRMKELVINIDPVEDYEAIEELWLKRRERKSNLAEMFRSDKKIIAQLKEELKERKEKRNARKSENKAKGVANTLLFLAGLPVYLYGAANHILPYQLLKLILSRLVSDAHWYGSIKLVGGMVLVPLFYLLQSSIVFQFTGDALISMAYLASLPVTGLLAHDFHVRFVSKRPALQGQVSRFDLGSVPTK